VDTAENEPLLYHLAVGAEWERAQALGEYRRSTIDTTLDEEGFIHFSFAHQLQGTADKFYRGRDDIVLLVIHPDRVGAEVRVEGGGSQKYPHLYGPLPVDAVITTHSVPMATDGRLETGGLM
jgi:uncharacterized protein (DUF952 family)